MYFTINKRNEYSLFSRIRTSSAQFGPKDYLSFNSVIEINVKHNELDKNLPYITILFEKSQYSRASYLFFQDDFYEEEEYEVFRNKHGQFDPLIDFYISALDEKCIFGKIKSKFYETIETLNCFNVTEYDLFNMNHFKIWSNMEEIYINSFEKNGLANLQKCLIGYYIAEIYNSEIQDSLKRYITLKLNESHFKSNYLFKILDTQIGNFATMRSFILHSHQIPTGNELEQFYGNSNNGNQTVSVRKIR